MRIQLLTLAACLCLGAQAQAAPRLPAPPAAPSHPSSVIRVAEGCPAGYWRGPWGHCRNTPYTGKTPNGGYVVKGTGCPRGFWRGPWGECRDTPYHGRLPDGSYE